MKLGECTLDDFITMLGTAFVVHHLCLSGTGSNSWYVWGKIPGGALIMGRRE